jgi:phosphatidylinositol-3-phosphatase
VTPSRRAVAAAIALLPLLAVALTASAQPLTTRAALAVGSYSKVMIIAEENEAESAVIGSSQAPYITELASTYGRATDMEAGYPVECPSLAAYVLMTSGGQQGICDDRLPPKHQLSVDNVFQQVAQSGQEWREFAESMPSNCARTNTRNRVYLVRHAPPPYYTSEATRCPIWDVPLGTPTAGALQSALASGLPAYSFVTPNACNDMHGAPSCKANKVKRGDTWLATWMPLIMAAPDFQEGRLLVIITWDEGSSRSNHIPTVVVGASISGVTSDAAYTHCSTLRTTEEVLGLPLLDCAATATSFADGFGLGVTGPVVGE